MFLLRRANLIFSVLHPSAFFPSLLGPNTALGSDALRLSPPAAVKNKVSRSDKTTESIIKIKIR
jgi:hypothetical protein